MSKTEFCGVTKATCPGCLIHPDKRVYLSADHQQNQPIIGFPTLHTEEATGRIFALTARSYRRIYIPNVNEKIAT